MKRQKIGRWVAGLAVLGALGLGSLAGAGTRYQTMELDWTAPSISVVAR